MANKTPTELRNYVTNQMSTNSKLLVQPFRIFFNYIIDILEGIISVEYLNEFIYKVFGTNNIDDVDIKTLMDKEGFDGETILAALLFMNDNKADLIDGKVPQNQLPPVGSTLEIYNHTITDLTSGEKTITHNLGTEIYLILFKDNISNKIIDIDNYPYDVNTVKVRNDIPLENQIEVKIIKIN